MTLADNDDTIVFYLRVLKTAFVFAVFSQVVLWVCQLMVFVAKRVCRVLSAPDQLGPATRNHTKPRRQRPT